MRQIHVKDLGEDFALAFYALAQVMRLQAVGVDTHPKATAQELLVAAAKATLKPGTEMPQFVIELLEFLMEPVEGKPGKGSRHLKVVREESPKA
jgi:hypothetical protein